MDKSETYIKMCLGVFKDIGYTKPGALPNLMILQEGAIEQRHIPPSKRTKYPILYSWEDKFGDIFRTSTQPSPLGELYRQDQIQEMMGTGIITLLRSFTSFWRKFYPNPHGKGLRDAWQIFTSMEQLWLAFYMWEKHEKLWNGEKWVKKEEGVKLT